MGVDCADLSAHTRTMPGDVPYTLFEPLGWDVPIVVSAPHSGGELPFTVADPALRAAMDGLNDSQVGQLALPAAASLGFPLIASRYGRAYIDLNRNEDELDPLLIEGVERPIDPLSRVGAGLGLIPRVAASGQPLYRDRLSLSAVQSRITRAYRPYHAKLQGLIDACIARFGACTLIDLHSMPPVLPAIARRALAATPGQPTVANRTYPDTPVTLVLGDDEGRGLSAARARDCLAFFQGRGMTIAHNRPYSGGYITQFYGRQVPALQLEICRSLYTGTNTSPHAKALERLFLDFATQLSLTPLREAAE